MNMRNMKPVNGVWSNNLWNDYLKAKERLVDSIFKRAEELGWSDAELARKAKVSYTTVFNLNSYRTRMPYHTTIWKLARAVGLEA